jgi:hypothetical protein
MKHVTYTKSSLRHVASSCDDALTVGAGPVPEHSARIRSFHDRTYSYLHLIKLTSPLTTFCANLALRSKTTVLILVGNSSDYYN